MTQDYLTQNLIKYLSQFVTQRKRGRMQQVLQQRTRHLTVVLENIFQPHNASAVIRSCDCFGVQDLHIIEQKNTFRPNKDIALGANQWVSLHKYQSSKACIEHLKNNGYQIAALTLKPYSQPLHELDITQKTALCFGMEEHGLSDIMHQHADHFVFIPMHGFTQSFNISVSAAISLYSLTEKLRASTQNWQLNDHEQQTLSLEWLIRATPKGKLLVREYLKKPV